MIEFTFVVGRAFLDYSSHPITVPKSQVEYGQIVEERLGPELRVVSPSGTQRSGRLYDGTAGYGKYYQIRMRAGSGDITGGLRVGVRLKVCLAREGRSTLAVIAFA